METDSHHSEKIKDPSRPERELRYISNSRPEREWRLNVPIYNLIKSPSNIYRNYMDYVDENPRALLHEDRNPRALLHEDRNPRALLHDENGADVNQFAVVPYRDYNSYVQSECSDCEEVFSSVKALEQHRHTCM